ncbi:hypothetical protein C1I95_25715 [Micromonospora craterilacus]|uniref:Uncharacterized protein n=1 Tax=Micromonospora craterilacus TaxID=1655439 RepID=A0A2W2E6Z0_9ACTN|nr:hypothetical protein [Micromonospora craterilacus]PZG12449.1 hypothetical protein C1I95_25715 [Micromonospora craterilacus]
MTTLDARTIAADIMTMNARDVTETEIWAHIGQAYEDRDVDPAVVAEALTLIAEAGIDLIWPDSTKDTELDAARVENERLEAELDQLRAERDRLVAERAPMLRLVKAVRVWRVQFYKPVIWPRAAAVVAALDALPLAGNGVTGQITFADGVWSLRCSHHGLVGGGNGDADEHDRLVRLWAEHDQKMHGGDGVVDIDRLIDPRAVND